MKKFLLFLSLIILFSCSDKKKRFTERFIYYNSTTDTLLTQKIWQQANDTINKWINELELQYWAFNKHEYRKKWKLLKEVYLSSNQKYCLLYCPAWHPEKGDFNESLKVILGEKYEGRWWFYPGPTYAILRKHYGNSNAPIPFEELKKTARRIAMGWYYKEERKSFGDCNNFLLKFDFDGYNQCRKLNYTINDAAFKESMFEVARYHYPKFLKEKYVPDKKQDVI